MKRKLDHFVDFVLEREAIRKRKEAGAPRPWTDDPILDKYSFCNVRRADDRVTKFIGEWLPTNPRTRWFACAVARWFNEPKTLAKLPSLDVRWQPAATLRVLRDISRQGNSIFRAAYIITGALSKKGDTKYETVVNSVLTPLWNKIPRLATDSIEGSWHELRKYPGMGSFMAGQIVADWQTFGVINGRDVNTWAPLGPGSTKGLNEIFGEQPDRPKLNQKQAVWEMQIVRLHMSKRAPQLTSTLSLHDIQNCLCEYSKYCRGYAKTYYKPSQESFL
jgi:hypothetical protein